MKKRSECNCLCHTDAYILGNSPIIQHCIPCCEPDDNLIVPDKSDMNIKPDSREAIDLLKWKLTEISCIEPEHIECNDLEILGENEHGQEMSSLHLGSASFHHHICTFIVCTSGRRDNGTIQGSRL